ncbi:MAG TPA: histidine kinase [Propionibacteriaceae bacterium]|nr:histidine kinase [Propionibacteriaceae bacterium]
MSAAIEATDAEVPSAALEAGVAMVALAVAVLVGSGWFLGFHIDNVHNGLIAASFTAVGLYVVRMRRRHREGWLFVAVGVVHAVMFFGRQYGRVEGALPGASWFGWLGVWPLPLAIALVGWTLMAFPHGRMLSPAWRRACLVMLAIAAAMATMSALWPVDHDRIGLVSSHPLELPGAEVAARFWPYLLPNYALFQVLWTASVVVRLRRARGDEARQMRWLVYATVIALVLLVMGLAVFGSPVLGALSVPLIPAAAGIAILKYRLYDIDPVLNKTLVIGSLILLITVGYIAIVIGVGALIPVGPGWLSLLTTAIVAVAFEPLRRRAQRVADRLVYGDRPTPYEALSRLSSQLNQAPDDLLDGLAATVANAVGASEVVVWVGEEARLLPQAGWPRPPDPCEPSQVGELDSRPPRFVWPVVHQGSLRGAITLRKPVGVALTTSEERLVADLVAQTGLVIAQQQQAKELQAAARRIVSAQDSARRRIERDLHDGAQDRLVTMGLELGSLEEHVKATAGPELAARVREVRGQLLEATAELRELARGLHPMVLTQAGLEAALRVLADRSALPVRVSVYLGGRLPREIEATAYYIVSEALTNAARHSGAEVVTVEIAEIGQGLQVRISDNGRGGARLDDGGGLQGLADRLAAVGANLTIDSPVGGGTRIRTVLPCA